MNKNDSLENEELDFSKISGMNDLIETITEDKNFPKRLFTVTIIYHNKGSNTTPSHPKNIYTFGYRTINDVFKKNNVYIQIYDDSIDIQDMQKGSLPTITASAKKLLDEEKIITALDCWKSHYEN